MKIVTYLLKELERPDDQGRDWYGWATNQMSHILLGLSISAVALPLTTPLLSLMWALGAAAIKEVSDLLRGGNLKDSVQDLHFQLLGAFLAVFIFTNFCQGIWIVVATSALFLLCGVIPRVKKLFKSME
jgi:MFS superfamily sulfate permease-like transporter